MAVGAGVTGETCTRVSVDALCTTSTIQTRSADTFIDIGLAELSCKSRWADARKIPGLVWVCSIDASTTVQTRKRRKGSTVRVGQTGVPYISAGRTAISLGTGTRECAWRRQIRSIRALPIVQTSLTDN